LALSSAMARAQTPEAPLATPLQPYRRHLGELGAALATTYERGRVGDLAARASALAETLAGQFGYEGDRQSYDAIENADLRRVIDRRRGLPVALSILYLHAARAQGWEAVGINFPGHFLIRLSLGPSRLILDPFDRGAPRDPGALRQLVKRALGESVELLPAHYAAMSDRDLLLRLQGNIRLRAVHRRDWTLAATSIETMIWLAPERGELWREIGMVRNELGSPIAAIQAFTRALELGGPGVDRQKLAKLIQELKAKLH
jgi:regulator of sirC expression with transglutaminase-like and TPR domain